jgi:hypothetical protein
MRTVAPLLALFAFTACDDGTIRPIGDGPDTTYPPEPLSFQVQDRRVQRLRPAVDVLFVIDNSCSMDAEQQRLAANFPIFAEYFALSGIDYHIGVVSTDVSGAGAGLLQRVGGESWVDRDTPNPAAVFGQMARLGVGGSFEEQGRSAAYTAIETRGDSPRNEGFERDDASLHLIFISDEDDVSTNPSPQEFRRWMRNLKDEPDMVTAHALVWPTGASCPDGLSEGASYQLYAQWTGGIVGNICDPNWGGFLDELGLQTSGLQTEFFLSELPADPDAIEVQVIQERDDGTQVTLGFEVCDGCDVIYVPRRNSVVFQDLIPGPRDEVVVDYERR